MSRSFYARNGYDVEIVIGTLMITTALRQKEFGLCDQLIVTGGENAARTATFSFIPPEAIIDLEEFQAQTVSIFFRTPIDGWQQVFAGFVDVPSLDFYTRKVTLQCTDDRENKVIQLEEGLISKIGVYSKAIFGETTDKADELSKRMQTVTASFDFDRYGNPILTSWTPKTIADFTLVSEHVRQESKPQVTYVSRAKTINTVNLTFTYTYPRWHQQAVFFSWLGYQEFLRDWFQAGKPSFPTVEQVLAAAKIGSWKLLDTNTRTITTELWPAGFYSGITWQPNKVESTYVGRTKLIGYLKDSTGNFVTIGSPAKLVPQYAPVLDAKGKQIMDEVKRVITDTSSHLCRGARWASALRFSQTVKETFSINIFCPQSIAKYGVVNSYASYNVTDPTDSDKWEQSREVTQTLSNFYIDNKTNFSEVLLAIQAGYFKAKHDIMQVHRDVTVNFQTKVLMPKIDLQHTIDFSVTDPKSSTAHINAKGKVSTITHNIDFGKETAYSDITLAISKSQGVGTNSPATINLPVHNPSYIGNPQSIGLKTYAGINPDPLVTPGADKWVGWITNKDVTNTSNQGVTRSTYSESFTVDYPSIPDSLRNEIEYQAETNLSIAIPNDYLDTST